jgi:hypothetical protein
MAAPGVAASGTGTGTPASAGAGGQNPFWEVTNLFSQKNKIGGFAGLINAGIQSIGGQINFGNYFRGLRLQVRTVTPGVGAFTPPTTYTGDKGFQLFAQMGIQNTDGAEILFDVINGFAYYERHKYGRSWLKDWAAAYDYFNLYGTTGISFTAFLATEVRQQLGALENTDTRSQYTFSANIAASGAGNSQLGTFATTQPNLAVTPYTDMWAQPDNNDLEGVSNQRIPPGVNFQTKTRHQIFALGVNGTDNNFLSTLTGNALRLVLWIARDSAGNRQDAFTEPLTLTLDNRNLGNLSQDQLWRWADDQCGSFGITARDTGVYPLVRWYDPGNMYGQGWLYTANSTAFNLETVTGAGAPSGGPAPSTTGPGVVTTPGTVELLQEEVYAVGAIDPSLIDI